MTATLALTLVGLALIDSVNVSTLKTVAIILLVARRPTATGWMYAIGALVSFMALAFALYFGAQAASEVVAEFSLWVRRIIYVVLAVAFVVFGVRKLKTRQRGGIPKLPAWINPYTGILLGALATVADIFNAFPLFLALDRIVEVDVSAGTAVLTLVVYSLIYILPTFALLGLGLIYRKRVVVKLEQFLGRFIGGESKASWKMACVWFGLALTSLVAAILMM